MRSSLGAALLGLASLAIAGCAHPLAPLWTKVGELERRIEAHQDTLVALRGDLEAEAAARGELAAFLSDLNADMPYRIEHGWLLPETTPTDVRPAEEITPVEVTPLPGDQQVFIGGEDLVAVIVSAEPPDVPYSGSLTATLIPGQFVLARLATIKDKATVVHLLPSGKLVVTDRVYYIALFSR